MADKNAQTWEVTASPRDRYQLAMLLLHRDIKIKGNKSARELHRARQALGLLAPHDAIMQYKADSVNEEHRQDSITYHRFAVTAENAECVLGWADKLEINPAHARWLYDVLAQLDKSAVHVERGGGSYDEEADVLLWKPRGKPLLDNPWLFAEALGEVIERAGTWAEFKRLYAEGMEVETPTPHEHEHAEASPS